MPFHMSSTIIIFNFHFRPFFPRGKTPGSRVRLAFNGCDNNADKMSRFLRVFIYSSFFLFGAVIKQKSRHYQFEVCCTTV